MLFFFTPAGLYRSVTVDDILKLKCLHAEQLSLRLKEQSEKVSVCACVCMLRYISSTHYILVSSAHHYQVMMKLLGTGSSSHQDCHDYLLSK